jgi:NAD(P)-dependent dehydrogenase (short-subunit alcohol dehydrogenase family)
MLADLTGKKALVTGAGMGIGLGIAKVLSQQGADVAIADVTLDLATAAAKEIKNSTALPIELDVTSLDLVRKAFAKVLANWGHLDILVNNAGVSGAPQQMKQNNPFADWEVTLNINLMGTVRCCEEVIPHMKGRRYGKIINSASISAHAAHPRPYGAYGVSKMGVARYTKGLAKVLGPFNINCNAFSPGAVWTNFHLQGWSRRIAEDVSLKGKDPYQLFQEFYIPQFPMRRTQTVEDIGYAVAFLASDDARNITGQCIRIDGGFIIDD